MQYKFNKDQLIVTLLTNRGFKVSPQTLGTNFASKLKKSLDGVDIIDDNLICRTILHNITKFKFVEVIPTEIEKPGLRYKITSTITQNTLYTIVLNQLNFG